MLTTRSNIAHLLHSAGGRFASVEFVKKDGTPRRMIIQPSTGKFHIKGTQPDQSALRRSRHPHLLPIWDAQNKGWRSVNLDTVYALTVDRTRFVVVR